MKKDKQKTIDSKGQIHAAATSSRSKIKGKPSRSTAFNHFFNYFCKCKSKSLQIKHFKKWQRI